ncbi:MAG: uracil permease [Pseudothermotoga sp.]|uniref:ABC transporter permease n=1 Tax=Pseudothermotoga hypogea DSM 11164 = NBRC 106472 TaxID=1123384 RepID=A0A0X1KP00_9THEM|nr:MULTISPECIES: solute carrier family 23 protein [Pseudothermotoga]AJC72944.1 ABC transporter permease [Pseudothermotoga hypogea DSM 11164 = NBRC 106472]MBC7116735.1 uracil permease [Pseudothermotoga sp.]MDI6862014.1 solute carrier family 23 protein [Pseudothermotoga sp.]HBT39504.1 uracil permease [Pseudothermotoga sp.]
MVDSSLTLAHQQVRGLKFFLLSLQHFVAMFGATVLVPLLTGLDPLVALFTAGAGTLLFHVITGGIVPVFLGSSFAFIAPIIMVKEQLGDLAYATGGIFVAGLVYLIFALLVWFVGTDKIKRLFPPLVTGPMIVVIGLTLSPVAIQMASQNWLVAMVVVVTVILTSVLLKGFWSMIPVLFGVLAGYAVSLPLGLVDVSAVQQSGWLSVPHFILPKFNWTAIATIAPVSIATVMEHIGDITTNGAVVGKNFFEKPGLYRTLIGDGLATSLAGLLGGPANTTYSENTGVLALTRVYDPRVLRGAAFLAMLVAFLSKFGAVLRTIPTPVIGGISLILFGMIASVGIRTLVNAQVDFSRPKNLLVASLILTVGIGGAVLKINHVEFKGLSLAAIIGIVANLLVPDKKG